MQKLVLLKPVCSSLPILDYVKRNYKDQGMRGLLEVKHAPGKVPLMSGSDLERLKKRLQEPSGFTSYGQIQQWLKSELGLSLAYKTVYEIVRKRLGAKLKVPRPQSTKQHPESISHLKKNAFSIQILAGRIWRGKTIEVLVRLLKHV